MLGEVYAITELEYANARPILKQVTAWVELVLEVNVDFQLVPLRHAREKFLAVAMGYALVTQRMCASAVMGGWVQTAPCVFVLRVLRGLVHQLLPILLMIYKNVLI